MRLDAVPIGENPPIELPFDEMELRRTDWALWPEPYTLQMRRLGGLDIIVGRDTVQWLKRHTDVLPFGSGAGLSAQSGS